MAKKILIVEDEKNIIRGLKINLVDEGYEVDWAATGPEGLKKALNDSPDLVILDIMLPGMSGLEVCRELRGQKKNMSIIMLTAKKEEIDKVLGLEIGADDYMTKPFSVRELTARIKACLRRNPREWEAPKSFCFGNVEVDLGRFLVRRAGKEVVLTSKEMALLKYLVQHRGEVITRNDLLDKVWGHERFPVTRTVDTHMVRLRKKLEEDPSNPRHLLSVYGEGYRFVV